MGESARGINDPSPISAAVVMDLTLRKFEMLKSRSKCRTGVSAVTT